MSDRLTTAKINVSNYRHNMRELRGILPRDTKIMTVLKANAYGHGLEKMAAVALSEGAAYLGVVSLGEAKRLRNVGISAPIMILNYIDAASVAEAIRYDITLTVMDSEVISAIEAEAASESKQVKVHLKVDTGMHRAGCDPEELVTLAHNLSDSPHIDFEGFFTHMAESENPDKTFTNAQLELFESLVRKLHESGIAPPLIHAANGAAVIAHPRSHYTMVRPGLISYGVNPFSADHPDYASVAARFKPVLSLHTKIAHIRTIETGESVGYNRRWRASRPSKIALLPVGYGDGFRRAPHMDGKVLVKGEYAPIVGAISMDQTSIDVTDLDTAKVGDHVTLLGSEDSSGISIEELADSYETIGYEVLTSLSERIVRDYIDDST